MLGESHRGFAGGTTSRCSERAVSTELKETAQGTAPTVEEVTQTGCHEKTQQQEWKGSGLKPNVFSSMLWEVCGYIGVWWSLLHFALFWNETNNFCHVLLFRSFFPLWKLGVPCTNSFSLHLIFLSLPVSFLTACPTKGLCCSLLLPWTRCFSPCRIWRIQRAG